MMHSRGSSVVWLLLASSMGGCSFGGVVIEDNGAGGDGAGGATVNGGAATGPGGGGSGGDVGGGNSECVVAADCPVATEQCWEAACDGGSCTQVPMSEGTAIDLQTEGDCQLQICDGEGNIEIQPDISDPPGAQPCIDFECSDKGGVVEVLKSMGTTCGVDQECNATGQCVGCTTAADCAAVTCQDVACVVDTCQYTPSALGTIVPGSPSNDCKKNQCNGAGNVETVPDNNDLPVTDANPCTEQACTFGVASYPNRAAGTVGPAENGVSCNGVCQAGTYAGTCGLRLYARNFPGGGAWTSVALSSFWNGTNAPPPTDITAAEETSTGSRIMVFRQSGASNQYFEYANGNWKTPVNISTMGMSGNPTLGAAAGGHFGGVAGELLVVSTVAPNPQFYQYSVPTNGNSPLVFQGTGPMTDESAKPNAPAQHIATTNWAFAEQKAPYGTPPESLIGWKSVQGNVYRQDSTDFSYPAPPQSESASAMAITGTGGAPAPGTVREAFYRVSTTTLYIIAP